MVTRHHFLNEQHWSELLNAVFKEVEKRQPPSGPLGELWRHMIEANKYTRFTLEVENSGANDNVTHIENYQRGPVPRHWRHRR
jgi:hypothetical protein